MLLRFVICLSVVLIQDVLHSLLSHVIYEL